MTDDQLDAAWASFAASLRENERAKIKRRWLLLAEQRSRLSDLGQSSDDSRAYQWMAMAGVPRREPGSG